MGRYGVAWGNWNVDLPKPHTWEETECGATGITLLYISAHILVYQKRKGRGLIFVLCSTLFDKQHTVQCRVSLKRATKMKLRTFGLYGTRVKRFSISIFRLGDAGEGVWGQSKAERELCKLWILLLPGGGLKIAESTWESGSCWWNNEKRFVALAATLS